MNEIARTPIVAPFRKKLDMINDQLCFGAFYAFEASLQLHDQSVASFTTDAFPHNPYASRIHRRVKELAEFEEIYLNQSALMAMQAGVETVQAYFCAVRKHTAALHKIDMSSGESADDEALHEQIISINCRTTTELFETAVYLRRRRNHLIHQLSEPSSEMKKFWKAGGAQRLDEFWLKRPAELFGFDFSNRALDAFRIEDGFAIMNLLRICMLEIDRDVAQSLPRDALLEEIEKSVLSEKPHLKGDNNRLRNKVLSRLQRDYGIILS